MLAATYVEAPPAAQGRATMVATVHPTARSQALGPVTAKADGHAGRTTLLAGFGLIALATLLISLLQSLGFASWALFTLVCAMASEVGMTFWDAAPFNGIGLVTGALVAVLVAIPPVIGLFLRPGRVLATILWIS
jgi:hypothetical protein